MKHIAYRLATALTSLAAAALVSAPALAQVPAAPAAPPPAAAPAPVSPPVAPPVEAAPAPVAPPAAPAAPAAAPAPAAGDTDLAMHIHRTGVGFMGLNGIAYGLDADGNTLTIPAPVIGIRHWLTPGMGLDVGAGFAWGTSSTEGISNGTTFGFVLHGGLPLVVASARHVAFQIVPYVSLGYGKTSVGTGAAEDSSGGFGLNIGARTGFEVFFGFIGIPQLALSATVGIQFEYLNITREVGNVSTSTAANWFSTTVQNDPWDIFTGAVAARYYF